jgi:Holliday junction resolvase RusA-like endonuclease
MRHSRAPRAVPRTSVPDLDKLVRALLDGLTGIAFEDDCQVHSVEASKVNVIGKENEGAMVEVIYDEDILGNGADETHKEET